MPNHLKFCGCQMCRRGLHRSGGKNPAKVANRRLRHNAKAALKRGTEPPRVVAVGYTG